MNDIQKNLDILFPDAHCELQYFNDFSFLIAVLLSAQTTDKKVNVVTKELFVSYPDVKSLSGANLEDLIRILKPLGLANTKAKNIKKLATILLEKYDGNVPTTRNEIESLPGVGRKTCNVFLSEIYQIPNFAVDTHVLRVSNRLGLVDSNDVLEVEKELKAIFDEKDWIKLHHQFIFFGRYLCKAKNPECFRCPFKEICRKKD